LGAEKAKYRLKGNLLADYFFPFSEGSQNVIILEDGWTAVTDDKSRAAQFEHTVLITETGVDILTQ
jgi:methionine aminopeptidase